MMEMLERFKDVALMKDEDVAPLVAMTINTLRSRRYRERGLLIAGRPGDLVPRWVDMPGGKRGRVLGTPPVEVEAWIRRNLV